MSNKFTIQIYSWINNVLRERMTVWRQKAAIMLYNSYTPITFTRHFLDWLWDLLASVGLFLDSGYLGAIDHKSYNSFQGYTVQLTLWSNFAQYNFKMFWEIPLKSYKTYETALSWVFIFANEIKTLHFSTLSSQEDNESILHLTLLSHSSALWLTTNSCSIFSPYKTSHYHV